MPLQIIHALRDVCIVTFSIIYLVLPVCVNAQDSPRDCLRLLEGTMKKIGADKIPDETRISIRTACIEGDTDGAVKMLIDAAAIGKTGRKNPVSTKTVHPPEIFRFYTTESVVRSGESAKLVWDVDDAREVILKSSEGLFKKVAQDGSMRITPKRSTFYELVATSPAGRQTDQTRIRVSPYKRATVTSPISSVELCGSLDERGESFRCINRDGPFKAGQKIHVIVRFSSLNGVRHRIESIVREKPVFGKGRWKIIEKRQQIFNKNAGRGPVEIATTIKAGSHASQHRLSLIVDRRVNWRASVPFCVSCPGDDEW